MVDGAMSQGARMLSGVRHGTVLGPLLVLTYIDDITNDIKGQIRLFADDDLLYHPIKTEADGCVLQGDLNSLHRWSKRWKMAFKGALYRIWCGVNRLGDSVVKVV